MVLSPFLILRLSPFALLRGAQIQEENLKVKHLLPMRLGSGAPRWPGTSEAGSLGAQRVEWSVERVSGGARVRRSASPVPSAGTRLVLRFRPGCLGKCVHTDTCGASNDPRRGFPNERGEPGWGLEGVAEKRR